MNYWDYKHKMKDPDFAKAVGRIKELEGALRQINAHNDSPTRYNADIQAVLDLAIDTSDVKFERTT